MPLPRGVSKSQIRRDKGLRAIYSETKEIAFCPLESAAWRRCLRRLSRCARCCSMLRENVKLLPVLDRVLIANLLRVQVGVSVTWALDVRRAGEGVVLHDLPQIVFASKVLEALPAQHPQGRNAFLAQHVSAGLSEMKTPQESRRD